MIKYIHQLKALQSVLNPGILLGGDFFQPPDKYDLYKL